MHNIYSKHYRLNTLLMVLPVFFVLLFACKQAFEESLVSKNVKLLAPVNGLTTQDSIHTFYWELVKDADNYQLQIVFPRFDSIARLRLDTVIKLNQLPVKLIKGNYQWRVKALNSGSSSEFSNPNTLIIQ